jgi:hypothetical protein
LNWQLLRLFCLLTAIGGVVLFFYVLHVKNDLAACARWPTVEGKILKYSSGFRMVRSSGRSGPRETAVYSPKILYEYEVAGKKYTGTRIAYVDKKNVENVAMIDIRQVLPEEFTTVKSDKVIVYYDPAKPQNCMLLPAYNQLTLWIGMGLGIGMVIFAIIFFFMVNASAPAADE